MPRAKGAWRRRFHVVCGVRPLPFLVMLAVTSLAFIDGNLHFGASVLVAFHCYLRTGEIFKIRFGNILFDPTVVIALYDTKIGKRACHAESVSVDDSFVITVLREMASRWPSGFLLPISPWSFRQQFDRYIQVLGFPSGYFSPYSLRKGGATYDFLRSSDLQRVMWRGRWQSLKSARVYIQEGRAALTAVSMSEAQRKICTQAAAVLVASFESCPRPL